MLNNLPNKYPNDKTHNKETVSQRNHIVPWSSARTWNACHRMFGSFHQNYQRFPDESRGFQCTCNALCMLSYSACCEVDSSSKLDKILCDGDTVYQHVINRLKAQGKFIHPLLSLEEIANDFIVETGKFTVEKQPIVSGILVDTQENLGLPTLHNALHSCFTSSASGPLTIGAICCAIFKKNNLYVFFDSHSHGKNGLSSAERRSILVSFSCLDDLISYMYAFYDSIRKDMSLQFDFLPVTVRKYDKKDHTGQTLETNTLKFSENIAERTADSIVGSTADSLPKISESAEDELQLPAKCFAESFAECFAKEAKCFAECFAIEAECSADNNLNLHKDFDVTFADAFPDVAHGRFRIEVADNDMLKRSSIGKERKNRTEYNEMYKKKQRQDPAFKANEIRYQRESKQNARQDTAFKANERLSKQSARQDPAFYANERLSKQNARQDPAFKANERESKQNARQDPAFKANERESKQKERQDPAFKASEIIYQRKSKQKERQDPAFKASEVIYQRESKQKEGKTRSCFYSKRDNKYISVHQSRMQDKILPLKQMSMHLSRIKAKILPLKQMR